MAQRKSEEEISRANSVNLPSFLAAQGYDLMKVGRNEYTMREHDSMRIYDNSSGEMGKWYRFSQNRGGTNIDFVREFMGKSFAEAVDLLNGEYYIDHTQNAERHSVVAATKERAEQHEIHIDENADKKRAIAYLSKTRGLDYNLVTNLIKSGQITQEAKTGNAVFLIKDENGNTVGAEKVGTSTEKRYKGIEEGSNSEYGFEVVRGNGKNAMFFESAIDMLSFVQLYGEGLDDVRFVSMAGVKPDTVEATIRRNGISPENVYLCSDNDKAGNEFADKLIEKYPQMRRITAQNEFKDWNDQLRNIPTQKEQTVDVSSLFEKFLEADDAAAKFSHYSLEAKKQFQEKYFAEGIGETEWRDKLTPTGYEYVARFDEFIAFGVDVLGDDFINAVSAEKEKFNAPFEAIAVNYWGEENAQDMSKHLVKAKFASFATPKIPVAECETAQIIRNVWNEEMVISEKEQTIEAENSPMANESEKKNQANEITIDSKGIYLDYNGEELEGTYSTVDSFIINNENKEIFELESDNYGFTSDVGHVIADKERNVYAVNIHSREEALDALSARTAEVIKKADNVIENSAKSRENAADNKLILVLNSVRERKQNKIENLKEKISACKEKILRQEMKIDKLTHRADKLAMANASLKSLFNAHIPKPIQAIINANVKRFDRIMNELIPKRENKISNQLAKIERHTHKIEKAQCTVDKVESMHRIVKSFATLDKSERHKEFSAAMDSLHSAEKRAVDFKIAKCDEKIAALMQEYEAAPDYDKISINRKIKEQQSKKSVLSEKAEKMAAIDKPFAEQSEDVIDKNIEAAENQIDKLNDDIEADAPMKDTDIVDSLSENICTACDDIVQDAEVNQSLENSPLANNIFGDTKYSDINDKFYVTVPADKAQEVSQKLSLNGIKHSGRIYENGEAKITISRFDAKAYKKAVSAEKEQEKSSVLNEIKLIKKEQEAKAQDEKPKKQTNKREMAI